MVRLHWMLKQWKEKWSSWFGKRNSGPKSRVRVCPGCGVLLDPADTFCFQCGVPVSSETLPGVRLWVKRRLNLQGEITKGIVLINFFVFILTWILTPEKQGFFMSIHFDVLNRFGAKNTFLIMEKDQYWRLILYSFLHANLFHIFFNMWALLNLGAMVEHFYGWGRFLFFYTGSGILAALASIVAYPAIPSIGASGAIMGLAGVLLAYSVRRWSADGKIIGKALFRWVLYVLIIGFILSGYVDNAAHVGGLLGGFFLALPFSPYPFEKKWERVLEGFLGWGSFFLIFVSFAFMIFSR